MTDNRISHLSTDEANISLMLQIRELASKIEEVSHLNELTVQELARRRSTQDSSKGCNQFTCDFDQTGISNLKLESIKEKLNNKLQNLLNEHNKLQALSSDKPKFTRKNPTLHSSKDSSQSKRMLFEKIKKVLNDDNDENMPAVTTEADSLLMKNKSLTTPSSRRSKTQIYDVSMNLSGTNVDSKLDKINSILAHYSGMEPSITNPESLKYNSNSAYQSIFQGGNAILTEAKVGLVSLQELNNQLRDNLLRFNDLGLERHFAFRAESCPNSPTSKGDFHKECLNMGALKIYISHLQEALTNLVLETSQERTIYKQRIRFLELSLESTIKKYENKLKDQKHQLALDPELIEELKKITKCSQIILEKDSNEYSKEEITIMKTLKELSKKPADVQQGMIKDYTSLNVSLCSSPSAFTRPASIFGQLFAPNVSNNMSQLLNDSVMLSRRSSQDISISYEDTKNALGEGPNRKHINILSQNLLPTINVLDSVSQKQNEVDSQSLPNRKKQELASTNIKGASTTNRDGRQILGLKEANQAILDLSLSNISSINVAKNKENDIYQKRCPEESYGYIQSLEREIESLRTRLAACERNLITKVYEGEEPGNAKLKEKDMNEKKRMIAIEAKKLSLRKRLIELEREKIDRKKQELANVSEKIISAIESHSKTPRQSCPSSSREATVSSKIKK